MQNAVVLKAAGSMQPGLSAADAVAAAVLLLAGVGVIVAATTAAVRSARRAMEDGYWAQESVRGSSRHGSQRYAAVPQASADEGSIGDRGSAGSNRRRGGTARGEYAALPSSVPRTRRTTFPN